MCPRWESNPACKPMLLDASLDGIAVFQLCDFLKQYDRDFKNTCCLDDIQYNYSCTNIFKVQYILAELVMGGMVLETNMTEIITRIEEQNKLEKSEVMLYGMKVKSWIQHSTVHINPLALRIAKTP